MRCTSGLTLGLTFRSRRSHDGHALVSLLDEVDELAHSVCVAALGALALAAVVFLHTATHESARCVVGIVFVRPGERARGREALPRAVERADALGRRRAAAEGREVRGLALMARRPCCCGALRRSSARLSFERSERLKDALVCGVEPGRVVAVPTVSA